jgi:hypothetical protein
VRPKKIVPNAPLDGFEADVGVLDHLRDQEGRAHEEGEAEARLQPGAVVALDRLQRPVHGEARGQQDRRVHPGHELRQLERRQRQGSASGLTTRMKK